MSLQDILQMVVGGGGIAILWNIQRTVGSISTSLTFLKEGFQDHERRIRSNERTLARRDERGEA